MQRVGRVLCFSQVVGIRTPSTPHPLARVLPPVLGGGVGRVPVPARGHTLWYSLYIRTLWLTHTLYVLTIFYSYSFNATKSFEIHFDMKTFQINKRERDSTYDQKLYIENHLQTSSCSHRPSELFFILIPCS